MSYSENASPITSSGYEKRSPIKAISDSDDDQSPRSTGSPRSFVSTDSTDSTGSIGLKSTKSVKFNTKVNDGYDGYAPFIPGYDEYVKSRNDIYDTDFSTIDNFFETLVEFEKMVSGNQLLNR
jgi:hypothetical protein